MSSRPSSIDRVPQFTMNLRLEALGPRESKPPGILAGHSLGISELDLTDEREVCDPSMDWDAIHERIQLSLDQLTNRVLLEVPHASWRAGRSSASIFSLYSFRTFERLDGDDHDAVIVGITCINEDGIVRIEGDISGDETGRIYFDKGCSRHSEAQGDLVCSAVGQVAEILASQQQIVVSAILDRDRLIVDRPDPLR